MVEGRFDGEERVVKNLKSNGIARSPFSLKNV
jgi:hypothetical protein